MRLFSLLYIAASHTVHVNFFLFLCIVSCYICGFIIIIFLNLFLYIIFDIFLI